MDLHEKNSSGARGILVQKLLFERGFLANFDRLFFRRQVHFALSWFS
jgi:hypothetical protein